MRKPNIVGGGKNTNLNGKAFEKATMLALKFVNHPLYSMQTGSVVENKSGKALGVLYDGYGDFYRNLIKAGGIDWQSILTKQLQPDDVILIGDTVYIIEKKSQKGNGSVDEKLQTCDFKRRQYQKLVNPLNLKVEYYFLLDDFFQHKKYGDVKRYIKDVGCDYFFGSIPFDRLGL